MEKNKVPPNKLKSKMKNYTGRELIDIHKNKDNYQLLPELDHVDEKKKNTVVGLPFFNGIFARNFLRGNALEGWMDIAALNDAGIFGRPLTTPFYIEKAKPGSKEHVVVTCRIKGDVVLVKCDKTGVPVQKLIVKPTNEQIEKVKKTKAKA